MSSSDDDFRIKSVRGPMRGRTIVNGLKSMPVAVQKRRKAKVWTDSSSDSDDCLKSVSKTRYLPKSSFSGLKMPQYRTTMPQFKRKSKEGMWGDSSSDGGYQSGSVSDAGGSTPGPPEAQSPTPVESPEEAESKTDETVVTDPDEPRNEGAETDKEEESTPPTTVIRKHPKPEQEEEEAKSESGKNLNAEFAEAASSGDPGDGDQQSDIITETLKKFFKELNVSKIDIDRPQLTHDDFAGDLRGEMKSYAKAAVKERMGDMYKSDLSVQEFSSKLETEEEQVEKEIEEIFAEKYLQYEKGYHTAKDNLHEKSAKEAPLVVDALFEKHRKLFTVPKVDISKRALDHDDPSVGLKAMQSAVRGDIDAMYAAKEITLAQEGAYKKYAREQFQKILRNEFNPYKAAYQWQKQNPGKTPPVEDRVVLAQPNLSSPQGVSLSKLGKQIAATPGAVYNLAAGGARMVSSAFAPGTVGSTALTLTGNASKGAAVGIMSQIQQIAAQTNKTVGAAAKKHITEENIKSIAKSSAGLFAAAANSVKEAVSSFVTDFSDRVNKPQDWEIKRDERIVRMLLDNLESKTGNIMSNGETFMQKTDPDWTDALERQPIFLTDPQFPRDLKRIIAHYQIKNLPPSEWHNASEWAKANMDEMESAQIRWESLSHEMQEKELKEIKQNQTTTRSTKALQDAPLPHRLQAVAQQGAGASGKSAFGATPINMNQLGIEAPKGRSDMSDAEKQKISQERHRIETEKLAKHNELANQAERELETSRGDIGAAKTSRDKVAASFSHGQHPAHAQKEMSDEQRSAAQKKLEVIEANMATRAQREKYPDMGLQTEAETDTDRTPEKSFAPQQSAASAASPQTLGGSQLQLFKFQDYLHTMTPTLRNRIDKTTPPFTGHILNAEAFDDATKYSEAKKRFLTDIEKTLVKSKVPVKQKEEALNIATEHLNKVYDDAYADYFRKRRRDEIKTRKRLERRIHGIERRQARRERKAAQERKEEVTAESQSDSEGDTDGEGSVPESGTDEEQEERKQEAQAKVESPDKLNVKSSDLDATVPELAQLSRNLIGAQKLNPVTATAILKSLFTRIQEQATNGRKQLPQGLAISDSGAFKMSGRKGYVSTTLRRIESVIGNLGRQLPKQKEIYKEASSGKAKSRRRE